MIKSPNLRKTISSGYQVKGILMRAPMCCHTVKQSSQAVSVQAPPVHFVGGATGDSWRVTSGGWSGGWSMLIGSWYNI